MTHFRLSAQARADLEEIWLFIAEDDLQAADRFNALLLSKIISLAKQPLIGRAREDLRPGVRGFPVGNYVIFYRDTPAAVEIIRILHGARDIASLV